MMTLPITEPVINGHSRNTRKLKFRKESLIYGPVTTEGTVIQTRIWKHARSTNRYFLDISKIVGADPMQLLHSQYHSDKMNATFYFSKNGENYLECYPDVSIVKKFATEGLFHEKSNTRVIPCKAIEGDGQVINMSITDLPMVDRNKLAAGLQATLQQYGVVLDIGRLVDAKYGFFMGEGYATIYVDNNIKYPPLTHSLPFFEEDYFYITYSNMNTWCRYCHEDGHTKLQCEKARANTFCFACDEYGHKRKDCPKK